MRIAIEYKLIVTRVRNNFSFDEKGQVKQNEQSFLLPKNSIYAFDLSTYKILYTMLRTVNVPFEVCILSQGAQPLILAPLDSIRPRSMMRGGLLNMCSFSSRSIPQFILLIK